MGAWVPKASSCKLSAQHACTSQALKLWARLLLLQTLHCRDALLAPEAQGMLTIEDV